MSPAPLVLKNWAADHLWIQLAHVGQELQGILITRDKDRRKRQRERERDRQRAARGKEERSHDTGSEGIRYTCRGGRGPMFVCNGKTRRGEMVNTKAENEKEAVCCKLSELLSHVHVDPRQTK